MRIHVQRIHVHHATGGAFDVGMSLEPRALCTDGGDTLGPGLHLWAVDDPDRVTCPNCIEWMHA